MDKAVSRIDVALVAQGLCKSREKAQSLIKAGLVTQNGKSVKKASQETVEGDELRALGDDVPYVGRGALKLIRALECFPTKTQGVVAMDIGASTGGFTQVLLQNGAKKVYAIDVGTGQLARELSEDARVVNMEKTNARQLVPDMFPEKPTLAVSDVSFISLKLILPAAFHVLGDAGEMIALVKPQFEAGPGDIGKHGIVKDIRVHERVLKDISAFVSGTGWAFAGLAASPVRGGDGNTEFLAHFLPGDRAEKRVGEKEIRETVNRAQHME